MSVSSAAVFLALTWVLWWIALVGAGSILLRGRRPSMRHAGWIGIFVVTAWSMVVSLIVPLGSMAARWSAWILVALGVTAFLACGYWRRWRIIAGVAAAAVVIALLSSVTPSNYDLGLYHAGSIAYVREGGTVVGLANLHDRFGFTSSMWPLSAFLGLGIWDGSEFRLVNGLLLILVAVDVVSRWRQGRGRTPSAVTLLFGLMLLGGAIVQYPGRLIASSAQDWAVAALMVVSTAYILDVVGRPARQRDVTAAIVTASLAGAMRPMGWLFAVMTVGVLAWIIWRKLGARRAAVMISPGVAGGLVLGTAAAIRDVLTSGWLLFPAGYLPLPVPWRYPTPSQTAQDITAWARTPFQDPAQTLGDTSWIPGWFLRLPTDWAVFASLALAGVCCLWLLVSASARSRLAPHLRTTAFALTPSASVILAWLVVAPDPRFAWGPLLLIVLVPLSVMISTTSNFRIGPVVVLSGTVLVAVALARGSLVEVSWDLRSLPPAATDEEFLADGTKVRVPRTGDQCWGEFPLCRPWYSDRDVMLRGDGWPSGFQPKSRLRDNQE